MGKRILQVVDAAALLALFFFASGMDSEGKGFAICGAAVLLSAGWLFLRRHAIEQYCD